MQGRELCPSPPSNLLRKANTTVHVVRAEANNPSGGFILSATSYKNNGPVTGRAIGTITLSLHIDTVIGPTPTDMRIAPFQRPIARPQHVGQ